VGGIGVASIIREEVTTNEDDERSAHDEAHFDEPEGSHRREGRLKLLPAEYRLISVIAVLRRPVLIVITPSGGWPRGAVAALRLPLALERLTRIEDGLPLLQP
jgi:hypothetical protein